MDYLYAGFSKRFGAGFIDLLVCLPFLFTHYFLYSQSRSMAIGTDIVFLLLYTVYPLYFHARFGQTLGKMAMKIRVIRTDGQAIRWKESWLRHSVEIFFSILKISGQVIALSAISDIAFAEGMKEGIPFDSYEAFQTSLMALNPFPNWINYIAAAWSCSELLTLLFNRQRRALHDFIAGTMVVVLTPEDWSNKMVPLMVPAQGS